MTWNRCPYTEIVDGRERRCVKAPGEHKHLLATVVTLLDVIQ